MEKHSEIKWNNYHCKEQPDASPANCAEWKIPIPKGYKMFDFIHIAFLKWQNYRNGKLITRCQKRRRGWFGRWEGAGKGHLRTQALGQHPPWLWQPQYPGCDTLPWFCEMVPPGKTGYRIYRLSGSLCIISYNHAEIYNCLKIEVSFSKQWVIEMTQH